MAQLKLTRKQIIHYALEHAKLQHAKKCREAEAVIEETREKIRAIIRAKVEEFKGEKMREFEAGEKAVKRVIKKHFGEEATESFNIRFQHYVDSRDSYCIDIRCTHTLMNESLNIKTTKSFEQQELEAQVKDLEAQLRKLYSQNHYINEDALVKAQLKEDEELMEAIKVLGNKALEIVISDD